MSDTARCQLCSIWGACEKTDELELDDIDVEADPTFSPEYSGILSFSDPLITLTDPGRAFPVTGGDLNRGTGSDPLFD